MPRRRALRTLAGAVAAVAVPGAVRPQSALAGVRRVSRAIPATRPSVRPSTRLGVCERSCSNPFPIPCLCKGPTHGCFETCGQPGSTCCCIKGEDGNNAGVVACPPGTRCGRRGESNCPCVNTCGRGCCGAGQFCANPGRNLCCKTGERGCGFGCCDPNEECRTARVGGTSSSICVKRCPPGQAWCGRDKCCPRGWRCANERTGLCKRCGQNEEECRHEVLRPFDEPLLRRERLLPERALVLHRRGRRTLLPAEDEVREQHPSRRTAGSRRDSPRVCCPQERYNRQPALCCPPGEIALNSPGLVVGPGLNPFCCKSSPGLPVHERDHLLPERSDRNADVLRWKVRRHAVRPEELRKLRKRLRFGRSAVEGSAPSHDRPERERRIREESPMTFALIARLVLAAVFLVAGVAKLADRRGHAGRQSSPSARPSGAAGALAIAPTRRRAGNRRAAAASRRGRLRSAR